MDDLLIATSFTALAMAPLCAKWWNNALKKTGISRRSKVSGVLLLSLGTITLVYVGPWVLMMILHGTLASNLADPRFLRGLLIFFGPGIALQVIAALSIALQPSQTSS